MLSTQEILYFGSIVSLRVSQEPRFYMCGDGFGSDKIVFEDLEATHTNLFSKSLFLVLPTFTNDAKRTLGKLEELLAGKNWDAKQTKCQELLANTWSEFSTNIEVLDTNLETPVKFNLTSVQLFHINSHKFLSLSESEMTGESVRLCLVDMPGSTTVFKFNNSLKFQVEGECLIYFKVPLKLTSAKESQGLYPSLQLSLNTGKSIIEPYCSLDGDTDLEIVFFKREDEELQDNKLRGGDLVQISQLDHGIGLAVKNNLDKKMKMFGQSNRKQDEYTLSLESIQTQESAETIAYTNSLWVVEHPFKGDGSFIEWNKPIRLFSFASQQYLCISNTPKDGSHYYLGPLDPSNSKNSLFRFYSANSDPNEKNLLSNDYTSLRSDLNKQYMALQPVEGKAEFILDIMTKHMEEHTFKITKTDRSNNDSSYFQLAAHQNLSQMLWTLREFKSKKAYNEAQDLRKKVIPVIRLVIRLRAFLHNRFLVSNSKEKFGEKNRKRQEFLTQQQYVYFLSLVLGDLFDSTELKLLKEDEWREGPYHVTIQKVLNQEISLEEIIKLGSFKRKASKKITEDQVMAEFMALLAAKTYLANELYGLLTEICYLHEGNQRQAYDCSVFFLNHFGALPSAASFISSLLCENQYNARRLSEHMNYKRIKDLMPNPEKIEVDLIVSDPLYLLTDSFKEMRKEVLQEQMVVEGRRRVVNPIIYCGSLIAVSNDIRIVIKATRLLSDICILKGESNTAAQDLVYQLLTLIPDIRSKLFQDFVIKNNQIYLTDESSEDGFVRLEEILE